MHDDMHVKQILVLVIILTRIRGNIYWFKLAMEKSSKYLYLFLIIDTLVVAFYNLASFQN